MASTTLEMARTPQASRRRASQAGDGPMRHALDDPGGVAAGSGPARRCAPPPGRRRRGPASASLTSGRRTGWPRAAATSRAMPRWERQSGRLGVTLTSRSTSSRWSAWAMGVPGVEVRVQDEEAGGVGGEPELPGRAEHAEGLDAAELGLLDPGAAGEHRARRWRGARGRPPRSSWRRRRPGGARRRRGRWRSPRASRRWGASPRRGPGPPPRRPGRRRRAPPPRPRGRRR